VLQLPELQLEHALLLPVPATRVGTPPSEVLKQAKVDILRRADLWQEGHSASWSAWLRERSSSKVEPHSGQVYSYIGMIFIS
jgi:hypothetical protein